MIVPLLLLSACVSTGFSYDSHEEQYGNTHKIFLSRRAHSLKFIPEAYNSHETILWKRDDPEASEDGRGRVMDNYFVMHHLTQQDNGRYVMLDKNQRQVYTKAIWVTANQISYALTPGALLNISSPINPASCYIYFYPEDNTHLIKDEAEIVYKGRLKHVYTCKGLELMEPCGVLKTSVQNSCSGRFEFRDASDDLALEVFVTVESPTYDPSHIGIGIGASVASFFCCCCVRRCCCKKNASKKDGAETDAAAAEPAVVYREYVHEPVAVGSGRLSQPSETHPPNPPSYAPTVPLIHSPPTVNSPPSYSEVSAPAEQANAPTVPLYSDPGIRFELKGRNFPSAPPLSSDSTFCHVYNSDKLNYI